MQGKVATRSCIACAARADKRALVRFVRDVSDGRARLDASGKAPGRGAYLCCKPACFVKARTKRLLGARLHCKVDEADYDRLEREFRDFIG